MNLRRSQIPKAKKLKIKQGSTVRVITGADRGKEGQVLLVDDRRLKVKVQGVRLLTHFDQKEGLHQAEGFIDYSNVKLIQKAAAKKKTKKKTKKASAKA